jgi:hypothetical protein
MLRGVKNQKNLQKNIRTTEDSFIKAEDSLVFESTFGGRLINIKGSSWKVVGKNGNVMLTGA